MYKKTDTRLTNKLKLIIATILMFISYSSFPQTNKINVNSFSLDIEGGINVSIR